jgi:hypothetical protein
MFAAVCGYIADTNAALAAAASEKQQVLLLNQQLLAQLQNSLTHYAAQAAATSSIIEKTMSIPASVTAQLHPDSQLLLFTLMRILSPGEQQAVVSILQDLSPLLPHASTAELTAKLYEEGIKFAHAYVGISTSLLQAVILQQPQILQLLLVTAEQLLALPEAIADESWAFAAESDCLDDVVQLLEQGAAILRSQPPAAPQHSPAASASSRPSAAEYAARHANHPCCVEAFEESVECKVSTAFTGMDP